MRKGIVLALLALLMASPSHADEKMVDGVRYAIESDRAVVMGYSDEATVIIFHARIDGLPVVFDPDNYNVAGGERALELVIEEGVTDLEDARLYNLNGVEKVTFPSTLKKISGFYGFSNIRELEIPEGVTSLEFAFEGCEKLASVVLPASLREMDSASFGSCPELMSIAFRSDNPVFECVDNVIFSKDLTELLWFSCGRGGEYQIPMGTKKLAGNAFGYNPNLTRVTVPESVETLPESVFWGCYALQVIDIPASVSSIEEYALPGWGDLKTVRIDPANAWYESIDGIPYEKATHTMVVYPSAHGASYTVEAGTERISDVFSYNRMLESIILPQSVTEIDEGAFSGCTSLERISLPMGLKEIPSRAFDDCFMLADIVLPPFLERIGEGAFSNCPSIQRLFLPEGLKSIGAYAFYGCTGLSSITLPDSVETLDQFAFGGMEEGFVIYASEGSAGYRYARDNDILWAVPGGTPVLAYELERIHTSIAIVNLESAGGQLDLYEMPSENAARIGRYPHGTPVDVLSEDGKFFRVRAGNAEGYMRADSLARPVPEVKNPRIALAFTNEIPCTLRLYEYALETAPSIPVDEESFLRIIEPFGTWYRVEWDGHTGYVQANAVSVGYRGWERYGELYAVFNPNQSDRLNLRSEPTKNSQSLGKFFNGTVVQVILDEDGWYDASTEWFHVRVGDLEGYMLSEFLKSVHCGLEPEWGVPHG